VRIRSTSVLAVAGSIVAAAAQNTPALAADKPLQPFRPWVLDYADAQCFAFRDYGDLSDPMTLAIRPSPNGETYELLVGRQRVGPKLAEESAGSVDFGRGRIDAWLLSYGVKVKETGKQVIYHQFRISAAAMGQARSAPAVTFLMRGAEDATFSLAAMPELLDGLARCNLDLQQYWNMDGEKDGRIAVSAKGDVRKIFTIQDYPAEAMSRSQEGTSQFLLLIDEQGRVAGCHVERASGMPVFDTMGCQVIRERAKFTPAQDGKGRPVRSTVVTPPVTWRIEG
jgi:TonB family protein